MAKAKNDKGPRILICAISKVEFTYSGVGRPPLYCPEVKAARVKAQQKAARDKAKTKRDEFKKAA